jgi:GDP-D-mannose dehydratase
MLSHFTTGNAATTWTAKVDSLFGDFSKAKLVFERKSEVSFEELIATTIEYNLNYEPKYF